MVCSPMTCWPHPLSQSGLQHTYSMDCFVDPITIPINIYHEGVEKNNDDRKRHYFSSNRHDAAAELCEQMRLEILRTDWQREETLQEAN